MIDKKTDDEQCPDLEAFPSAEAQEGRPMRSARLKRRRERTWAGFCLRMVGVFAVLVLIAGGGLFFVLSRGPVSSEQVRAQVERQLSNLLGDRHQAIVGDAGIAVGKGGLLALGARDVRILRGGSINLGVAEEVDVVLDALALASGRVEARSIRMQGASISLLPHLPEGGTAPRSPWQGPVDLAGLMARLGEFAGQLEKTARDAELERFDVTNAALLGFEALGFRSRTAIAREVSLQRSPTENGGLLLTANIATEFASWKLRGEWRDTEGDVKSGARTLQLSLSVPTLREFVLGSGQRTIAPDGFDLSSPVELVLTAPFDADGTAAQPGLQVKLGEGTFNLTKSQRTTLTAAEFNLRLFPKTNQISLERSPIQFHNASAVLFGNVELTQQKEATDGIAYPSFELQASQIIATAMLPDETPAKANLSVRGTVDIGKRTLLADEISLDSATGSMTGKGRVIFGKGSPAVDLDLAMPQMQVREFKQLWPLWLAPGARRWALDGIFEGVVRDAWVKARLPAGVLSARKTIGKEQLQAHIPISGARVKTAGNLPYLQKAEGTVTYEGMVTRIDLASARARVGGDKTIAVGKSSLSIGDYRVLPLPAKLKLALSGDVKGLVELGHLEPLRFSKALGLKSDGMSGQVKAGVGVDLKLHKGGRVQATDWNADLKIKNGASKTPILDRRFTRADLAITVDRENAHIDGSANIDGVRAVVAMVQPLKGGQAAQHSVMLRLDAKARKRMGIKLEGLLKGAVTASVGDADNGGSSVTVDLTDARLDLPWVGWSKGKGVRATATFVLTQEKGITRIDKLVLNGKGFSASGALTADGRGLRSGRFRNVRLNRDDDVDVAIKRVKGGYDVEIDARSYDARAVIRAVLANRRRGTGGKERINLSGRLASVVGFNGQVLRDASIRLSQSGDRVARTSIRGTLSSGGRLELDLKPEKREQHTLIRTQNAGAALAFLDLYTKMQGGALHADLRQDRSRTMRGTITAEGFKILGEPRLASLLKPPPAQSAADSERAVLNRARQELAKVNRQDASVDKLVARLEKGKDYLIIRKGRLTGGDASAVFKGTVYDKNKRMSVSGTFLPGRGLNRLVSKIPLVGLAFGNGNSRGLLGITFRLRGPTSNPRIQVNPLSIIAPGVFRNLFRF